MKKVLFILLFTILYPVLSYAVGLFYLTDPQGNQHQVSMQMMLVEHGQLLPDGNYLTPMGATVTVKGGQIVTNAVTGKGNTINNSVSNTTPANTANPNNSALTYPLIPLPAPAVQPQSTSNTPTMSLQPSVHTIYTPPPNPNTPTMNQIGPTSPSQEPGAPGL